MSLFPLLNHSDGNISESEAEEDTDLHVTLPQTLNRKGNLEDNKSAIKLYEIGPRLTLQLIKVEEGLMTGEVLYHDHIVRTEEEKEQQRRQIEKKRRLKELRRREQAENLKKKQEEKAKEAKTKLKQSSNEGEEEGGGEVEPDDDVEYYRQEVGEEPDEALFQHNETKTKSLHRMKSKKAKKSRPVTKKRSSTTSTDDVGSSNQKSFGKRRKMMK